MIYAFLFWLENVHRMWVLARNISKIVAVFQIMYMYSVWGYLTCTQDNSTYINPTSAIADRSNLQKNWLHYGYHMFSFDPVLKTVYGVGVQWLVLMKL